MADDWSQFLTDAPPAVAAAAAAGPQGAQGDPWAAFRGAPAKAGEGGVTRATNDEGRPRITIGAGEAIRRGGAAGATFNFDDELNALSKLGGASDEQNGIQHLIGGIARYLMGSPEARADYEKFVAEERKSKEETKKDNPIIYPIAEVGGAIATAPAMGPLGGAVVPARVAQGAPIAARAVAVGKDVAARALQSARVGGAYGALAGAGDGEGAADTAVKAGVGGVVGAVTGGAISPALDAGGAVVKHVGGPIASAVRGAINPDKEAARTILMTMGHDVQADPRALLRMTPAEFRNTPDAVVADMGGEMTRALADNANIASQPARNLFRSHASERGATNHEGMVEWFKSHFNYPDAFQQRQAIRDVAKTINGPAYRQAFKDGDRSIITPEIERMLGSPMMVKAMKGAQTSGQDRAIVEGYGAFNPGVRVTEDGQVIFNKGKTGVPTYPNLQYWDAVKRELDGMASTAERQGDKPKADLAGRLAEKLRNELETAVGSYKGARQGAAAAFGAEDALQAGQKFVSSKMSASEARAALAKMSPAERRLFTDGFISDFIERVKGPQGMTMLNQINEAKNIAAREKLELVMGPGKYRELETKLRVVKIQKMLGDAVGGNSWTTRRLVDAGALTIGGSIAGHGAIDLDPKEAMVGTLVAALAGGGKKINADVSRRIAEMLLSRDPTVLNQGVKIVSGNPHLLDAFRAASTVINANLSQAIRPSLPVPQLTGPVRADDQQSVPGPAR